MKIFDMHADIGTDILERLEKGQTHIFKEQHFPKLINGEIGGVFTACFFCGTEDWSRMQKMVLACNANIDESPVRKVLNKEDLIDDDKMLTLISCEGLCGIKDDVSQKIQWLYDHGVRVASLVWNDSNDLAEGWPNDPLRGLSDKGKEALKKMDELHMIVDVSHANEKTFWDVVSATDRPVIASHSNARFLCDHQRNLTVQQIKAIGAKGGLIGLNAASYFVDEDKDKQDVNHLAKHARYLADLIGVEHVACGFDFMDFLDDYGDDEMAKGLHDASMAQNLIEALKLEGFSEYEISRIAFYNVFDFLKGQL